MLTLTLLVLCAAWLAPVVWVVTRNIRQRLRWQQPVTLRYVTQQVLTMLRWPLGIADRIRGR